MTSTGSADQEPGSDAELQSLAAHNKLWNYLHELWKRRAYVIHVPRSQLRSRNSDTLFGNLWQLLTPALSILVYFLVFGLGLKVSRGTDYYISFLAIGVLTFRFSQRSVSGAATSLTSNVGLLQSVRFPRAVLPLTAVTTESLVFLPSLALFLIVALLDGAPARLTWLLLPFLFGTQYLLNTGIGFFVARSNHAVRDVEKLLPFVFRLLFYGSGVLFVAGAYIENSFVKWMFYVNPLYCAITLYRWAVLGMPANLIEVCSLMIWTVLLLVSGFLWFHKAESSYGSK